MDVISGAITLRDLLERSVLEVPSYQRAYRWEEPNLERFLEDLQDHAAVHDNRPYFFGTILLNLGGSKRKLSDAMAYDVVDGQQRITTTCIFVTTVIERLRENPASFDSITAYHDLFIDDPRNGRRFKTVESDDLFFKAHILESQHYGRNEHTTESQGRLLKAKDFFKSQVATLSTEDLCRLVDTLANSRALVNAVASDIEATQVFELQNDRGIPLTPLEGIKSLLMHGLYLHADRHTESHLEHVQENFSQIYRFAEELEGKYDVRDAEDLLQDHLIAFEPWRHVQGVEGWTRPKDLIRLTLRDLPDAEKARWITAFSTRLRRTFRMARDIVAVRDDQGSHPLGYLAILGRNAAFWPLMLKCWEHDSGEREKFARAVEAMASHVFRSIISHKRWDKGVQEVRRLARYFEGDFDTLMVSLRENRDWGNSEAFFLENLGSSNLFNLSGHAVTYLLWRYENFLRQQRGRQSPPLSWKDVAMPKKPSEKFQRDHIAAKDASDPHGVLNTLVQWTPDSEPRPFEEVCLHRLGNLVLDTYSQGASKGNKDFISRFPHYTSDGTLLSQGELYKIFASRDEQNNYLWDAEAVKRRQKTLVDFAREHL